MKFTLSTKPFIDALSLGIVNQNVSKFYQKSCLAQITANRTTLRVNLEASFVLSELVLRGSGDSDEEETIFVDSLLLKNLVSTFEASTTTLEFAEGGLILHSGKSKFTLPKMLEGADLELQSPAAPQPGAEVINVDKSDWKFIKDYQMYAIAMSFIHPVYTRVWVGENGDVLVGDFDNSMFTHSKKGKLGRTCLLSDTIINLFNSLPEGAKLTRLETGYLINVQTDGFEYASQFTPQYEDDPGVGSYNSEIILGMMVRDNTASVKMNVATVKKFLAQAELLSSNTEDVIKFEVKDGQVSLTDNNVDCKVAVEGSTLESYSVDFKTVLLKSVVSNFDEDEIFVAPMKQENDIVGIALWTKNMTTILAGIDE